MPTSTKRFPRTAYVRRLEAIADDLERWGRMESDDGFDASIDTRNIVVRDRALYRARVILGVAGQLNKMAHTIRMLP